MESEVFEEKKIRAKNLYESHKEVYNPCFGKKIIFNSDGFHHLQFSGRTERIKSAQILKFSLLEEAIEIIKRSGTFQEYRKILTPIGKISAKGETSMKNVEYWAMIAIIGKRELKS